MNKYFVIFVMFFMVGCGNPTPTDVKSKNVNTTRSLISKTCAGGSFTVSSQSSVPGTTVQSLDAGTEVTVRGHINNSICHGGGRASFTCQGSVTIGSGRAIVCRAGTVSGSLGVGTRTTPYAPKAPLALNSLNNRLSPPLSPPPRPSLGLGGPQQLREGQILIYDNGTKGAVNLVFSNPKVPELGLICTAGFTC